MSAREKVLLAVHALVSKKAVADVTVQEIIDEAHISRATFYRIFADKYDAIYACYKNVADDLTTHFETDDWGRIINNLCHYVANNMLFFRHAFADKEEPSFFDELVKYTEYLFIDFFKKRGKEEYTEEERFILAYFCSGGADMIKKWVETGCAEPAENISAWAYRFIEVVIGEYFPEGKKIL